MKSLQEFYNDGGTKDNVHEYLIQYLKEEGIRRLLAKEDVSGIADAVEIIDMAFDNLDTIFQKELPPRETARETVNEAR